MNYKNWTDQDKLKERLLIALQLYQLWNQWQYHKEILEISARLYELTEDKFYLLKK